MILGNQFELIINLYLKFQTIKTKFKDLGAVLKIRPKMINNMPKIVKNAFFCQKMAPLSPILAKKIKFIKTL